MLCPPPHGLASSWWWSWRRDCLMKLMLLLRPPLRGLASNRWWFRTKLWRMWGGGQFVVFHGPWRLVDVRGCRGCADATRGNLVANPPHQVVCQAERASYLKWMDGRCFRCLSHKHFVVACQELLKYWCCYKEFHLVSQCPGPSSNPSSWVPSFGLSSVLGLAVSCRSSLLPGHVRTLNLY